MGDTARGYVAGAIETGRQFLAAKRELKREFLTLFAAHPRAIADPVQCTARTAQRLMAIAQHDVLTNATHGSHLPPSWRTLYELTKLDRKVLERALEDGAITPAMERRDVAGLRGPRNRALPRRVPGRLPSTDRDRLVTAFVFAGRTLARTLDADELEAFRIQITSALKTLRPGKRE
jgi:hypothetical protein